MNAWLTPNTLPASRLRRAVFLPDDPAWLEAFYGALDLLSSPENWEQYGAVTPAQAADAFFQTFSDCMDGRGHVLAVGDFFFSAQSDCPAGCLACDGSQVAQTDYPELYDVIGTTFGTAVGGNFTLPDCRGRTAIGVSAGHALGDAAGEETHTLSWNEMPQHDHSVAGHIDLSAVGPGDFPVFVPDLLPEITDHAGNSEAHNNMQPYLALHIYIVAR